MNKNITVFLLQKEKVVTEWLVVLMENKCRINLKMQIEKNIQYLFHAPKDFYLGLPQSFQQTIGRHLRTDIMLCDMLGLCVF